MILCVTRGFVIRDAEADKQLDLLAARVDSELPDALKLTAKEQELERVPFKSYVYENENAKYKRGSDKVIRSSEIGAGVFVLCNTRFCALYRTASLVEDAETVSAFETPYDAIAGVTYVSCAVRNDASDGGDGGHLLTAIVPNDALMDDFSNRLKNRPGHTVL